MKINRCNLTKSILVILSLLFGPLAYAKNCRKGIPCGNSCIAAWKTCHMGSSNGPSYYTSGIVRKTADKEEATTFSDSSHEAGLAIKKTGASFKFRSLGEGYFLSNSSDGKTVKCLISDCIYMSGLKKGARLEFLDNLKIVEFETRLGSHSCNVTSCSQLDN